MLKNLIAILLITYGVFGNSIFDVLDTPTPTPTPEVPSISITEPRDEIKVITDKIAAPVTDAEDRLEVALYFLEMSSRIEGYDDITLQQLNDLIIHSATLVFKGRLAGKYDQFDDRLMSAIIEIAGSTEHKLTPEEKSDLSDLFSGIAWSLVNRRVPPQ